MNKMAIEPIALSLFGLEIRWYGIAYALGFLFAYFFITHFAKDFGFEKNKIEDIFLYTMIFSVIGGRLFYAIFYNPQFFLSNPLQILAVWNGGMSIHGGFFAGLLTLYYQSKKHKINFLKLTDLFTLPLALGLAFGRLANFVNQELVGKVTNSPLGIIFPLHDNETRWPSTLFASIKNIVIFNILFFLFIFKKPRPGIITSLFLILYSSARFIIDFFREPEITISILSLGQIFSLLYLTFGIGLLIYSLKKSINLSEIKMNKGKNRKKVK